MKFLPSPNHPEVIIINPEIFADQRGFFMETYQKKLFMKTDLALDFVQDNQVFSKKGVLRGLHYQIRHPQGKLVRVIAGEIFDVAVDIRKSSPHFGTWVGILISADLKNQFWVPPGFAHGYYVLSDHAEVIYKVTDYYDAASERCIHWNDPQLAINWPIEPGNAPIISEKDAKGVNLTDAELFT
jgi:dTDP-4-dehydrorhamnose 3,5-epimerase